MSGVVVTGCDGFIGSHLMAALSAREAKVYGEDRYSCTGERIDDPSVVYHLAAEGNIQAHSDRHLNNTLLSVLSALDTYNPPRFVFTSSQAVHGDGTLPISVYGACKLGAEALINAWREKTGKRVSILRLGNVVGPRCRGVIPETLRKLRQNPERLAVLGDGTARKPFIHVEDVVRVLLDPPDGVHDVRPMSTTPVRDVIFACCERVGCKPVIEWGSEPRGWVGDIVEPARMRREDVFRGADAFVTMSSDQAVARAVDECYREVFA